MACCENNVDFCVDTGETFNPVVRWATDVIVSVPIVAITQAAPAVVTATAHGAPDGWKAAVISAKGMTQINASEFPPPDDELVKITAPTVNTAGLTSVNSADYSTYTTGGFLVYYAPADLASATGTFKIWDNADRIGTPLVSLAVGTGITLNNTLKTISILLNTAGVTWTSGYYALDMTVASVVTRVLRGTITII
jgi:hypothetical protein